MIPLPPPPPLPSPPLSSFSPSSSPLPPLPLSEKTYYGADGIDVDTLQDETQQEALKTMVKTYGQMPLQLFKDSHPPRSKTTVRTTLLIRFGFAIKKLTSSMSHQLKIVNPIIRYYMKVYRPKISGENEFIGKSQSPPHKKGSIIPTGCTPERIACIMSGEIAVTGFDAAFFPSSSQAHNSLLVTWGHWDNSLVVRSVGAEPSTLKLHHPPLNRVRGGVLTLMIALSVVSISFFKRCLFVSVCAMARCLLVQVQGVWSRFGN